MIFSLFQFWSHSAAFGFCILDFDLQRQDDQCYSLIGFCYAKEDRVLEIDILWKCLTFKL